MEYVIFVIIALFVVAFKSWNEAKKKANWERVIVHPTPPPVVAKVIEEEVFEPLPLQTSPQANPEEYKVDRQNYTKPSVEAIRSRESWRKAMVMKEILDRPLSARE